MPRFQNTILACASLFAAGGIGFVMQSSPIAELRYGAAPTQSIATAPAKPDPIYTENGPFSGKTSLELTSIAYTSAPVSRLSDADSVLSFRHHVPDALLVNAQQPDSLSASLVQQTPPPQAAVISDCEAVLSARPLAAAMVHLELTAPCAVEKRVTFHHNGMMITESTDNEGKLSLQLPALAENAVFMAAFDDGVIAMAKTEVTSLEIYDRVVVQWEGPGDMQIHAFEFGADYGDEGHIWAMAPHDMQRAVSGLGGFVSLHGRAMPDQDLRAQVYTFPTATAAQTGDIVLTVETEVTDQTCGRRMEGQALQITGGGALSVKDLTLDVPGCSATGDFLVLKNLLQDLKIARK
jgi:hypothetical protein